MGKDTYAVDMVKRPITVLCFVIAKVPLADGVDNGNLKGDRSEPQWAHLAFIKQAPLRPTVLTTKRLSAEDQPGLIDAVQEARWWLCILDELLGLRVRFAARRTDRVVLLSVRGVRSYSWPHSAMEAAGASNGTWQ